VRPEDTAQPRVALVALNAHYAHTSLAIRLLRNYAIEHQFPEANLVLCEWTINDLPQQLLQRLFAIDADIYAFSCYIWNRCLVDRLSEELAQIRPQATIIWGGPEASQDAHHILAENPAVDAIIAGEGEVAFTEFILRFRRDQDHLRRDQDRLRKDQDPPVVIPNLVFRAADGTVVANRPAPLLDPLQWPFPYTAAELDALKDRLLYFETSRGCPYGCTYCLSSLDRTVRLLPLPAVLSAFDRLICADIRQIKLVDRTFNIAPERATDIWHELITRHRREPFRTNFHFEIMADRLTEPSLDLLAEAPPGLIQFEIGVQTTTPEVLRTIHRPCDLPRLAANVRDLRIRSAIHLHLDLIAGLPGESLEQFAQAFNDVFALQPHQLQLGFLKVLPGSPMSHQAQTLNFRWSRTPPYEILASDRMNFADLAMLKDIEAVLDWYHNSGRFAVTVPWLVARVSSPFVFFQQLAAACRTAGWFDRQASQPARAAFLLGFGRSLVAPAEHPFLLARLKLDYLLQGAKDQPEFLDCIETSTDPDRQQLKQLGRERIRAGFPKQSRFRLEDFVFDAMIELDPSQLASAPTPGAEGQMSFPKGCRKTILPAGCVLAGFDLAGPLPRLLFAQNGEILG